jgi:hypothetical protein
MLTIPERILFFKFNNSNWSEMEDQFLKLFINKYGWNQWKKISSLFFGKTPAICMKRWWSWINPDVKKSRWNIIEDKKLNLFHIKFIYRFDIISLILKRNLLQCFFRFRFIQIARKIFKNQKKKKKIVFNSSSNQNIVFYEKTLDYKNIDYLKTKLRYLNKNTKKNFKNKYTIKLIKNLENSNVDYKTNYFKPPKLCDQFFNFTKLIFIFKIFQTRLVDLNKSDVNINAFIILLKQNGFFFSLFIPNYEFFWLGEKRKNLSERIQVNTYGQIFLKLCLHIIKRIKLNFFDYHWFCFIKDFIVCSLEKFKRIVFDLNYHHFNLVCKIIAFNFYETFWLERLHNINLQHLN